MKEAREWSMEIKHECGSVKKLYVDPQATGFDQKLIKMVNQRTGAYCYTCDMINKEAHDISRIQQGFYMNMGMERLGKYSNSFHSSIA